MKETFQRVLEAFNFARRQGYSSYQFSTTTLRVLSSPFTVATLVRDCTRSGEFHAKSSPAAKLGKKGARATSLTSARVLTSRGGYTLDRCLYVSLCEKICIRNYSLLDLLFATQSASLNAECKIACDSTFA